MQPVRDGSETVRDRGTRHHGRGRPCISIGMPVYDGERYVAEAIESMLKQTFVDWELIISDNGSTDRTEEICTSYADRDPRISYHRSPTNRGAAWNFNRVFRLASGDYFKWAAHDDRCAPQFLEKCLAVLQREPEAVVAYPRTSFIDGEGRITGTLEDTLHLDEPEPHQRFRSFLQRPGWCHPVFGLIRSEVLSNTSLIGNFPRSDRNLIGELALYGHIFEVPEYSFQRRIHPLISTRVNRTERELAVWYDPLKRGHAVFPRWRRFYEYIRAIRRGAPTVRQRALCYLYLARYLFVPTRWIGLLDDLRWGFVTGLQGLLNGNGQPEPRRMRRE